MEEFDWQEAQIYDHYSPGVRGDVEFYVAEEVKSGSPVLELGCGTGRILIPVAETEVEIVGLDRGPFRAGGEQVWFVAYDVNDGSKTGTIQLIAVHPDHQNSGIGTELCNAATEDMQERGMKLASVETAGDASHAPARRAYEKAGYVGLPLVRFFKSLSE